eukprot:TRINITY_DN30944_c0_g2_i2.p1 TRINITY_DN30944_c0_g2~~TRINITY_DN30944_c0_g2_i2.p1  ORF type:complete len:390 (+),score=94.41 TRINITY_DN30944_c0_g2_i2:29-1198(+)
MIFFFLMIRRPPRSTLSSSSAASDVYKRQFHLRAWVGDQMLADGSLGAAVIADECVWTLEVEQGNETKVLMLSLPKAKPELWKRVFSTDPLERIRRTDAGSLREAPGFDPAQVSQTLFAAAEKDDVRGFDLAVQRFCELSSCDARTPEVALLEQCQTAHGKALVHAAAEAGSDAVLRLILAAHPGCMNWQCSDGRTPIASALAHGRGSSAAMLLQAGADVHICSHDGTTPLHYAARRQDAELVTVLVEKGSRLEARHESSGTPLQWSAAAGAVNSMAVLLQAGANPSAEDRPGQSVLCAAAAAGSLECCRLLLDSSADPKAAVRDSGKTALHFAAEEGHHEIAQFLVVADSALANTLTSEGLSLIHISEPTRLLSISYAVFCLKKKKNI